jgi:hypothetical protein
MTDIDEVLAKKIDFQNEAEAFDLLAEDNVGQVVVSFTGHSIQIEAYDTSERPIELDEVCIGSTTSRMCAGKGFPVSLAPTVTMAKTSLKARQHSMCPVEPSLLISLMRLSSREREISPGT